MLAYSKLLNRYYDPNNENVIYISNILQVARYLKNGAQDDLVDILYDNVKKEDTLVFVFKRSPKIKELYRKWQNHELD